MLPHLQQRREKEKAARRKAILQAALQVFGSQGYHGTRMDAIAEIAQLGKATLYYYFKSKDELLLAILEDGIREFFQLLESAWQNCSTPLAKIEQIPYVGARFFSEHPDYFKLYHYLTAHPTLREKALAQLHPLIAEKIRSIRQLFEAAIASGQIQPIPPDVLTEIFGSLIMGMGLFIHPPVTLAKLEERARYIWKIFLEGVRNQ